MVNNKDSLLELQEVEKDMAAVLVDICKKHQLRIWASYGTLLGCVRHKGFVPWDDDIDFVMMREDYDRLRKMVIDGAISLPKDSSYSFDLDRVEMMKLRHDGTSMILPGYKLSPKVNQSVWVDIFCLDDVPVDIIGFEKSYKFLRTILRIDANAYQWSFASSKGIVSKMWHGFCCAYSFFHPKDFILKKMKNILQKANKRGSDIVANILLYARTEKYKKYSQIKKYKKEWFDETVYLPFGDIELPCPKEYDSLLTEEYGDYMTPVKNASLHGEAIVDLSRPYIAIIQEKLEKIPRWKRYFHMH